MHTIVRKKKKTKKIGIKKYGGVNTPIIDEVKNSRNLPMFTKEMKEQLLEHQTITVDICKTYQNNPEHLYLACFYTLVDDYQNRLHTLLASTKTNEEVLLIVDDFFTSYESLTIRCAFTYEIGYDPIIYKYIHTCALAQVISQYGRKDLIDKINLRAVFFGRIHESFFTLYSDEDKDRWVTRHNIYAYEECMRCMMKWLFNSDWADEDYIKQSLIMYSHVLTTSIKQFEEHNVHNLYLSNMFNMVSSKEDPSEQGIFYQMIPKQYIFSLTEQKGNYKQTFDVMQEAYKMFNTPQDKSIRSTVTDPDHQGQRYWNFTKTHVVHEVSLHNINRHLRQENTLNSYVILFVDCIPWFLDRLSSFVSQDKRRSVNMYRQATRDLLTLLSFVREPSLPMKTLPSINIDAQAKSGKNKFIDCYRNHLQIVHNLSNYYLHTLALTLHFTKQVKLLYYYPIFQHVSTQITRQELMTAPFLIHTMSMFNIIEDHLAQNNHPLFVTSFENTFATYSWFTYYYIVDQYTCFTKRTSSPFKDRILRPCPVFTLQGVYGVIESHGDCVMNDNVVLGLLPLNTKNIFLDTFLKTLTSICLFYFQTYFKLQIFSTKDVFSLLWNVLCFEHVLQQPLFHNTLTLQDDFPLFRILEILSRCFETMFLEKTYTSDTSDTWSWFAHLLLILQVTCDYFLNTKDGAKLFISTTKSSKEIRRRFIEYAIMTEISAYKSKSKSNSDTARNFFTTDLNVSCHGPYIFQKNSISPVVSNSELSHQQTIFTFTNTKGSKQTLLRVEYVSPCVFLKHTNPPMEINTTFSKKYMQTMYKFTCLMRLGSPEEEFVNPLFQKNPLILDIPIQYDDLQNLLIQEGSYIRIDVLRMIYHAIGPHLTEDEKNIFMEEVRTRRKKLYKRNDIAIPTRKIWFDAFDYNYDYDDRSH
jgi:hypothetical protein